MDRELHLAALCQPGSPESPTVLRWNRRAGSKWFLEPGDECGLIPKNGVPQGGQVGSVRAAQKARLTMTSPCSGQLILGTDRRNPLFTVYAHEEGDKEELHVYYGLELLEVVPDDPEDPNFKMLVGRLYNAGLKLGVLEQTFQKDGKTIQRWGRALRSRNAEELIRVLEGRQASRKFSVEIQAYVRVRWAQLAGAGLYGIGKRLREEIASVFGVKLSPETLRPLMGELKRRGKEGVASPELAETTAEGLPEERVEAAAAQALSCEMAETPCGCVALAEAAPQVGWCDHLGLLVFAPVLVAVAQVGEAAGVLFKQWLASLLAGALNIEQSKFLSWPDLTRLLGSVVRFPHPQRQELERAATGSNLEALARFNAEQIGVEGPSQFYFDPHTKHYTGQANVLEGWCPRIRWADKAVHSDFVHTVKGEPLYFETTDNFADLRERFFEVVQRCRQVLGWPTERVVTWVVDRAIFGQEVFAKVLADPTLHLITWEKGYLAQAWPPPGGITGSLVIQRARNRAEDVRCYHLQYWDRPWPKDPRLRQIVVQATNPQGRVIQVAILTDDPTNAAVVIIGLMFNRWVQENDFKYLDKHFGINQITSYGVTDYAQLRGRVADRQVRSAEVKGLAQQRRQNRAAQSRLLLLQSRGEHQERQRQQRIQELEGQSEAAEAQRELSRLRQQQSRWVATHTARQEQIQKLSEALAQLEDQAQAAEQTESRLERMIAEQMVRLDPEKKRLMDSLRVIARNVFYQALAPFKKAYNNYRDDHDQFRQLTQASGVLEMGAHQVTVHLMPRVNYPPHLRRIIATVLDQINARDPVLPDGSGRRLKLRLAQRSEMQLSIHPAT